MTTAARILGSHAYFFMEGASYTVPSAGTASASAKPGSADTGWTSLGIISAASIARSGDVKEVWAPLPGTLRLKDVIEIKPDITLKLTARELSPLALQTLFRTAALTAASTQFNPLEGATLKGWIKLQQYDQSETLTLTLDVWVHLTIDGEVSMGEDISEVAFSARVLHSTLNTASI